jgi:hypothetical protein
MIFTPRKKYRVLMEGTNLVMDINGIGRFGYVATRYVRCVDSAKACSLALGLTRKELLSSGEILNEKDDLFTATVLAVTVIDSFKGIEVPGKGFTFFPEPFQPDAAPSTAHDASAPLFDSAH